MQRKVIALFLIVMIVFSSIQTFAIAENDNASKLFEFLSENLSINEELQITRATAAKIYCFAANLNENSANNPFSDINSSDDKGFIVTAYNMGYISINENGIFNPDGLISCYEFARGFVKLLGYQYIAERTGYEKYISSLGLLKGISGDYNANLTNKDATIIVFNALKAPYMVQTVYGTEPEYETNKNDTVLSYLHKINLVEGYANSIDVTSVYTSDGVGKDKIKIGNKIYKYNGAKEHLLGRYVNAYIKDNDTIIAAFADDSSNVEYKLYLDSNKFCEIENGYFCYEEENKKKKLKVSQVASYIYNGCYDANFSFEMLDDVKYGSITFLDNDANGIFDIVFVNEYTNYIVKGVSNSKIFDRHSKPFIDLANEDLVYFSIQKNSKKISIDEIKEWDTASVYKSKNNKIVKIEISDKKSFEKIDSQSQKDGYTIYGLSGKEYESAVNGTLDYILDLGEWGNFFFDSYGRISGADLKSDKTNYGFFISTVGEGKVSDTKLKILNDIGKCKVFDVHDKVLFNNFKKSEKDVAETLLDAQLISYECNANGEITKLNTVCENGITENASKVSGMWRTQSYAFASKYIVGTDTVIFSVPTDLTSVDEDDVSVVSASKLVSTQVYKNLYIYDMDKLHTAGAIVIKGEFTVDPGNNVYFITSVSKTCDSNGDVINILEYNKNGKIAKLFTDKKILGEIKPGMGIRIVALNKYGDISDYSIEFNGTESNYLDKYIAGDSNYGVGASCVTAMGVVENIGDGAFTIEGSDYMYKTSSSISCYDYKGIKSTYFMPVDFLELREGDRIFIVKSSDVVVSIVRMY